MTQASLLRRLPLAALAIAFAAILFTVSSAPPAQAQEPTATTFVSNTGQTADTSQDLGGIPVAMGFTTGANSDGYTLTSIDASVLTASDVGSETLSAELWSASSGVPGTKLADLTISQDIAAGTSTVTADAPAGTTLAASTTYFVVYRSSASGDDPNIYQIWYTASTNEDSGAASGWTIANNGHWFFLGDWTAVQGGIYQIAVKGHAITTFVSNTHLGNDQGHFLETHGLVQDFTTGTNSAGYTLTSISADMRVGGNPTQRSSSLAALRVQLWSDSSGSPGDKIADLTVPTTSSGSRVTLDFAAPAGTTLAANTKYHVVFFSTVQGAVTRSLSARSHSSDEEAQGKAAGWSIGNSAQRYAGSAAPTASTAYEQSNSSSQIAVKGYAAQATTTSTAIWSATLTVQDMSSEFRGMGCDSNSGTTAYLCSTATTLTDNTITLPDGTTYTVSSLNVDGGQLLLYFTETGDSGPYVVLQGYTLVIDGTEFDVADGMREGGTANAVQWTNTGLSWSAGDTVALSLIPSAPGVTVSKTSDTVTAGSTTTYTVRLNTQPTADVTITPTSSDTDKATVSGALTFTTTNWNQPQTVTVTGVAAGSSTITHAAVSTDTDYNSISIDDVEVTVNAATPTAPTAVTLSVTNTTVAENVGTVTVTATLDNAAGSGGVAVTLSAANASTATATADYTLPSQFTIAQGQTTGTATVAIVNDNLDESSETIVLSATTNPTLSVTGTTLTITDDDTHGVTVSKTSDTVPVGSTTTYTVVLDSQPTANVTITPTSGTTAAATVSGALTFTPSNWNVAQTVTVTGVQAGSSTITHAATSTDSQYNNETVGSVTVTVNAASTATTLVSNTGQTTTAGHRKSALEGTSFTTGQSTHGYVLESVGITFGTEVPRANLAVELWSKHPNRNGPGEKIADLTIPASVPAATVDFAAPANTRLAARTTYFLMVGITETPEQCP